MGGLRFFGASALAIALWTPGVMAQQAAAPQSAENAVDGEIIVTAQRRNERLVDVPIAITAASAEDLNRVRINDASRLQLLAPGLTWGSQGADAFPAVRGVRTQLVSAQSDPVIGYYIDGIYQSRTQQQSFPLFDIGRVEVQRGPQGTLYGRNTFGGNISVVTAQPTDEFAAGLNGQIGNYNLGRIDGFINVPLGEKAQLRVSGIHVEHDGYVRSLTNPAIDINDENQDAIRATLRLLPTESLEVTLTGAYWDRHENGGGAYGYRIGGTLINPATGQQSINGVPVAVNPTVRNGTAFVNGVDVGVPVSGGAWDNEWDYTPFLNLKEYYFTGQIAYDAGPVVLKSITGYNNFRAARSADLDQSSVVFPAAGVSGGFSGSGYQAADTDVETFSQEVQIASNDKSSPLEWIAGLYYFHDKITELYSQVYTAPSATALSTRSRTAINTKAYAAYAQASYALVPDKLKVIGGIRYSEETKGYHITNFTAPVGTEDFNTKTPAESSGDPKFKKVTWRGGLEYKATRNNMVYATVSTGFSSGGINNNSNNPLVPESYDAQTVTAYEIGTKNRFMGGRLSVDLSLFYNDFKNLQITILDALTNISYYASAGAARSYGAELDVKTMPFDGFHIDVTASLLNAKFTDYLRPNPFYSATNGDPVQVDLSGKRVPMSPKLKTTTNFYYDIDLGDNGRLSPGATWLYSASYYSTDYNTALDRQKAYSLFDASLRWTTASEKFFLEGYVNNIGNKAVLYSSTVGNRARIQQSYGPPRTYGLRAGVKF